MVQMVYCRQEALGSAQYAVDANDQDITGRRAKWLYKLPLVIIGKFETRMMKVYVSEGDDWMFDV